MEKHETKLKGRNIKYKLINEISDTNKVEKIKLFVGIDNIASLEQEDLINIVEKNKNNN